MRIQGRGLFVLLAVLVGIALVVLLGRELAAYFPGFVSWVRGQGAWAPLVFIAGYAVATVAFVPGSLLTLAAGAVFGLVEGVIYVLIGAALGSAAAFLIARYAARSRVERWMSEDRRFAAIDRAIGREGRKIVFLLRLSPVFPYNLLNYALGLTRVRFVDYLIASLGMLPGILLYVYSGRVAGEIVLAVGDAPVERGVGYYLVLVLGLLATGAVVLVVTRSARRALREAEA